jgi:hypothetical protein
MVIPMLMNNADDEQAEWWLQKAINREFCGTYAQTGKNHFTSLKIFFFIIKFYTISLIREMNTTNR